jgi:hypothetical protein
LKEALASFANQADAVKLFTAAIKSIPAVAAAAAVSVDKIAEALAKSLEQGNLVAKWVETKPLGVLASAANLAIRPVEALTLAVANTADALQAFVRSDKKLKDIGGFFSTVKVKATSAAVAIKDGVRAFLGFSDPKGMKGFKDFQHGLGGLGKSGGIGGALLGPLAPVMRLLQPLLDLVVDALQPAIETFGMLVKNAFAPFSFIADTIMQTLAPVIQKVIGPFASMMELLAVQVGTVLQGLLDTSGAAGGMSRLMPAFTKVADVLGSLATDVVPILFEVGSTLFDALLEVLPEVVDLVAELVKALAPLLVGLLKIGAALVKYVHGPILVGAIRLIAGLVKTMVPYIAEFSQAFLIGAEKVAKRIKEFFGNFAKNMTDFYVLWIKPVIDWLVALPTWIMSTLLPVNGTVVGFLAVVWATVTVWWNRLFGFFKSGWDLVVALFSFPTLTGTIGGAFSTLLQTLMAPLRALALFVSEWLVGPLNKVLSATLPFIGQIGRLIGIPGEIAVPNIGLAEGGIVTRPTFAQVGEAGPEAVIPLRPEAIERIIAPIFPKMEMPGLREMVGLLSDINSALHGTLKVAGVDEGAGASGGRGSDDADIFAAPGLSGAGGW